MGYKISQAATHKPCTHIFKCQGGTMVQFQWTYFFHRRTFTKGRENSRFLLQCGVKLTFTNGIAHIRFNHFESYFSLLMLSILSSSSLLTCGISCGKYNPLSGACPLMVASLKFTSGDFYWDCRIAFGLISYSVIWLISLLVHGS